MLEGLSRESLENSRKIKWEGISIEEHMKQYTDQNIDKKEAMKLVAADRGISKREVYQALL